MACALPSTASMNPRHPSSQHHLFGAYEDMGVRIQSQDPAGWNLGVPQMDAMINRGQKEPRNEIDFFSVNGSGYVEMGFADSSKQGNLAISNVTVGGLGGENLMMPYAPWSQVTDNTILIELRKARQDPRYREVVNPIKPPYSTSTLIAMAIENSPAKMLALAEIYQFIADVFPFYRQNSKTWQNTVRNKLSTECCFENHNRPEGHPGTGKVWSLNLDSIRTFGKGQLLRKIVLKDATQAKKPLVDPSVHAQGLTHQHKFMGMFNKPNEMETESQDSEMILPVAYSATVQVTTEYFSQHHQQHTRAPQNPTRMVWPYETASLYNYTPPSTENYGTNGYLFPRQQNDVDLHYQLHNHRGHGGYNYLGSVPAESNLQQQLISNLQDHHVNAYNGASNLGSSFPPVSMDTAFPGSESNDQPMPAEPRTESDMFRYYFQSLALIEEEYPYGIIDH